MVITVINIYLHFKQYLIPVHVITLFLVFTVLTLLSFIISGAEINTDVITSTHV